MYCTDCGATNADDVNYCTSCGKPIQDVLDDTTSQGLEGSLVDASHVVRIESRHGKNDTLFSAIGMVAYSLLFVPLFATIVISSLVSITDNSWVVIVAVCISIFVGIFLSKRIAFRKHIAPPLSLNKYSIAISAFLCVIVAFMHNLSSDDRDSSPNVATSTPVETTVAEVLAAQKPEADVEVTSLIGLRQGMDYSKAREIILDAGWQGQNKRLHDVPEYGTVTDIFFNNGWHEVEDCAGTGFAPCNFLFKDLQGNKLVVNTLGECLTENSELPKEGEKCDVSVNQWVLDKTSVSSPSTPDPGEQNIVLGRCHMNLCWWWKVDKFETVREEGGERLVKVSTEVTDAEYSNSVIDKHGYPTLPAKDAAWDSTSEKYVFCSKRVPTYISYDEEAAKFLGTIPFDHDGVPAGATEGVANLYLYVCNNINISNESEYPQLALSIDHKLEASQISIEKPVDIFSYSMGELEQSASSTPAFSGPVWRNSTYSTGVNIECPTISQSGKFYTIKCSVTNNKTYRIGIGDYYMEIYRNENYSGLIDKGIFPRTGVSPGETFDFEVTFMDRSGSNMEIKSFEVRESL